MRNSSVAGNGLRPGAGSCAPVHPESDRKHGRAVLTPTRRPGEGVILSLGQSESRSATVKSQFFHDSTALTRNSKRLRNPAHSSRLCRPDSNSSIPVKWFWSQTLGSTCGVPPFLRNHFPSARERMIWLNPDGIPDETGAMTTAVPRASPIAESGRVPAE